MLLWILLIHVTFHLFLIIICLLGFPKLLFYFDQLILLIHHIIHYIIIDSSISISIQISMMFIMTYPYNIKKKNSVCFWFVSNLHMLFFHSSIPYTQFIYFNYIFHLEYFLHSFILIFLFNLNISRVYFWQVLVFFQLKYFSCLFISSYNIFSSW